MSRIYKIGFYVFILIIALGVTYFNYTSNILGENSKYLDSKSIKRYDSILKSASMLAEPIEDIKAFDLYNGTEILVPFVRPTIVLIMSGMGCHPCMHREFEYYQKIYHDKKYNIIAICDEISRALIKKVKKIDKIEFPIYYMKDEGIKKYSFSDKYPQILFIYKNIVLSSCLPIPDDDDYSKWYAETVVKKYDKLSNDSKAEL